MIHLPSILKMKQRVIHQINKVNITTRFSTVWRFKFKPLFSYFNTLFTKYYFAVYNVVSNLIRTQFFKTRYDIIRHNEKCGTQIGL